QPPDDLAIGVQMSIGDHRAVQCQQEAIGFLPVQPLADLAHNLLENVMRHRPRWRCPCHNKRERLESFQACRFDETSHLMVRVAPFVDKRWTIDKTLRRECRPVCADRIERIRFVHETGECDPHATPLGFGYTGLTNAPTRCEDYPCYSV